MTATTAGTGPVASLRCAVASAQLGEPLAGTAPRATSWLLVEHAGPWGPRGWADSGVPEALADRTQRRADDLGMRIQLIRRHGVRHDAASTRVLLARTTPNGAWVRRFSVEDPAGLDDVPLEAVASPRPPASGAPVIGPVLLVCTHGRRDACCAELGRAAAARLTSIPGVEVWETTHTGGHRFAPNVVVLPDGVVYGRVERERLVEIVSAHTGGRLVLALLRGRSSASTWGQVAEVAVRRRLGLHGGGDVAVVSVDQHDDRASVELVTPAGPLSVGLERVPTGRPRPFSCGDDELRDPGEIRVVRVRPVTGG